MCARYINPAGITPRARWGHTLTPMQGQKLLLFGGMEIEEGETASLFEYDTHHISWDPVCVSGSVTPTPRTNHAACASGGRWLYISGGTTDRGTRVLGDLYCYDISTQEWTCLWEYGGSSTRSKHEPTPRFGHSMVSWEDRLYIFGGKTPKRDQGDSQSTQHVTVASTDVYVFSLTSRKWKRRIHAGKTIGGEWRREKHFKQQKKRGNPTTRRIICDTVNKCVFRTACKSFLSCGLCPW
ncbi:hypothetical protein TCDM_02594 [Trypanosoma cruzi Dm28c]|uniref:Uncharacterized protein n=1 Tax=Trypanosoma cruzi Dm28c TaxID=1416333 RepID=V5BR75_TRYCR|nr:hypothetical protein TCDM_02594 [Trypanosoma cruzi Dm28c]